MEPQIFQSLLSAREFLFESETIQEFLLWAKISSLLVSLALITGIVILSRKIMALQGERPVAAAEPTKPVKTKVARNIWAKIIKKSEGGSVQDLAFAIIEADKLVDTILESGGFPGDTMAERMKRISEHELPSIEALWSAHKLRNKIVHDAGFEVGEGEAREALRSYQKVLEDLEVI